MYETRNSENKQMFVAPQIVVGDNLCKINLAPQIVVYLRSTLYDPKAMSDINFGLNYHS